jgi:hypothetical protein
MNRLALAAVALGLLLSGCRAAHETLVRQRLLVTRLELAELRKTPAEIDALVNALDPAATTGLRRISLAVENAEHVWCVGVRDYEGCFSGVAEGTAGTRVRATGGRSPPPLVVHAFWELLDAPAANEAVALPDSDAPQLAEEEEARFAPRYSLTGGVRTGAVVSPESPAFTFGGQLGLRYWVNLFTIVGGAIEVENVLQQARSVVTLAPQARVELTLWRPENQRMANLPDVSFVMAAEPIFAFGRTLGAGARAVIGVQLVHLGRLPTPFFFELGYQSLEVDKHSLSGVRVALGVGL